MKFFRHDNTEPDELDLEEFELEEFDPEEFSPEDYSSAALQEEDGEESGFYHFDPYGLEDEDQDDEDRDVFGVPKRGVRLLPLLLVLALVCVGGVELTVCAFQAPELYARITAPFLTGVERLGELGRSMLDGASLAAVELARPEPEPDQEQPDLSDSDSQLLDSGAVAPPPRPVASFEITTLIEQDGREVLTGGALDILYYNQTDDQWTDTSYGTDSLSGYGCGPTAMAMAVSSMTDTDMDPAEMAQWCVEHKYWAKKHGSRLSIVQGAAEAFGLNCEPLPPEEADMDTVVRHLATGNVIVALMGPGHFTNRGHFILLRGITLDEGILVADPASAERSLTVWDLELILDELSASRHDGAPLWVLSRSLF